MGTSGSWPNFNAWLDTAWGAGGEYSSTANLARFGLASNFVFGPNPPFYLDDFKAQHPKFFGLATPLSGCTTTAGSTTIAVQSTQGLAEGQFVQASGILPKGSIIKSIQTSISTETISYGEAPQGSGTQYALSSAPPTGVIQLMRNGVFQTPSVDYALLGNQILLAVPMTNGDALWATWLAQTQLAPVHGEVPAGTAPGTTFTISSAPPNGILQTLTANGVFLTPGVDYFLFGVTITLTTPLAYGTLYATWLPAGYSITVNNAALVSVPSVTLQVYEAPPIPVTIVLMYLRLACASLVHRRWCEEWWPAIGWFISHYCTLYARSDSSEVFESLQTAVHGESPLGGTPGTAYTLSAAPPDGVLQALTKNGLFQTPNIDYTIVGNQVTLTVPTVQGDALYATWPISFQTLTSLAPNAAEIAAQGLAGGIQVSKSVGDVSVSYQPLETLASWGAWNLTLYGQQLATAAKIVGAGPALIW